MQDRRRQRKYFVESSPQTQDSKPKTPKPDRRFPHHALLGSSTFVCSSLGVDPKILIAGNAQSAGTGELQVGMRMRGQTLP